MSGHSKWSQIKRMKAVKDQKRGLAFSKLSSLIAVAVREGGGIADPEKNMRLRVLVEKAKYANMPKENILRALERAKSKDAQSQKEVIFEIIGREGVLMLVVGNTDNNNRTFSQVRGIVEKNGLKMGNAGSVAHFFQKVGEVIYDKNILEENTALENIETLGALELLEEEDEWRYLIPFATLGKLKFDTEQNPREILTCYRAFNPIETTEEYTEKIGLVVESLEELDDVVDIFTNLK